MPIKKSAALKSDFKPGNSNPKWSSDWFKSPKGYEYRLVGFGTDANSKRKFIAVQTKDRTLTIDLLDAKWLFEDLAFRRNALKLNLFPPTRPPIEVVIDKAIENKLDKFSVSIISPPTWIGKKRMKDAMSREMSRQRILVAQVKEMKTPHTEEEWHKPGWEVSGGLPDTKRSRH